MTYVKAKIGTGTHTFCKVLFDSGGSYSSIMQSAIPEGVATHAIEPKRLLSAAGESVHNRDVTLDESLTIYIDRKES